MTNAELIHRLIEETAQADDWRSGSVRPGLLPLFNYWGPVLYLTPAGDVVRNDDEDGPLRPADPAERDFGLARAAEHYPELVHLTPPRPRNATTCDRCLGRGRLMFSSEPPRYVYCPDCNSLGWTIDGGSPVTGAGGQACIP